MIYSKDMKRQLEAKVGSIRCPTCAGELLHVEWRWRAKPIGSYSLAGRQMKFSAGEAPYAVCSRCGAEGEIGEAEKDDGASTE